MSGVCTGLDLGLALNVAREFGYDTSFVLDVLADAEGVIIEKIRERASGDG